MNESGSYVLHGSQDERATGRRDNRRKKGGR